MWTNVALDIQSQQYDRVDHTELHAGHIVYIVQSANNSSSPYIRAHAL